MRRALRENGAIAVSMAAISSTLVAVVTATLSFQTKLMALASAFGGLFLLQHILVGMRRRSGHWLVQYGAMAAYYLPIPLVFYAAKVVYSTTLTHIDGYTPSRIAGVLYMFHMSVPLGKEDALLVTNMRAYSLHDRPQDGYNYLMLLVFLGWVDLEWTRWGGLYHLLPMALQFSLPLLTLFTHRSDSTLECQTKEVADYMKRESSKSSSTSTSPFFDDHDDDDDDDIDDDDDDDATSNSSLQLLDCCRYPFVQAGNGEWVTVKDLVQRDDLPNEDKDIWLSYSLCRLLARRYYGFHSAEEGDVKVRHLALADLRTTDGYKRAFTIAEVQLAFLHDYFFTASLPIIESGLKYIDATQQFLSIFSMIISIFFSGIPIAITTFMSLCSLFETPASWLVKNLLAFYWRPIHTAFRKIKDLPNGRLLILLFRSNPNAQEVFDPFQAQTGGAYWRNKIGQYSILQDYDRRRSLKKVLVDWFQRIMLSQPSYGLIKHLPVEEEEIDMLELDNMRELVADTLRDIDGPPTNGTRSLKINMDKINRDSVGYDWLLTCKQETHTDTILIWHTATCYCDMSRRHSDPSEGFPLLVETDVCHRVSTTLSRYCAYLVAFLPEFLPEHSLTTKQVFQRVLQEVQGALGTTPIEEKEKYTKMRELLLPHQHEQQTAFHKGVELGRQLEMIDDKKVRWKVIAEFWAETILYVAPSDNAEAHIEHLAKGGEFIMHLWAMLSNAGILKRAEGEWHPPPAPASTATGGPLTKTHKKTKTQGSVVRSNDEAPAPSMFFPSRQTLEDMLKQDGMRHFVANTLRDIEGPPTNGARSLKINMDTILIWHIATWYCDMTPISDDLLVKCHHEAARALSRCCPYLVAFLLEFLPEHSLTTKQVFQRVLQEAQQELGEKPMKEEEKRTKIRGLQLPNQHEQRTTFQKGVELGRQLEMLSDDKIRWKVIAKFWAETILYIVPSDNTSGPCSPTLASQSRQKENGIHLLASTTTEGPPTMETIKETPTQAISMVPSNDEAPAPSLFFPPRQTSVPSTNEKGIPLLEYYCQFLENAGKLYSGEEEFEKAKSAYQYKKGNDLMATKREIQYLPKYLGKLHEYYINDTRAGVGGFEVVVPTGLVFNKEEEEKHYVGYEALFQLFQRRDLDTQILMLWTLFEAKYCLEKSLDHIAFLDPMHVNEKTCKGDDGCDVTDLIDRLTTIFLKIKHKSNVLLAYNCAFHFVLVNIKLAESRIEVWDSKGRDLSQIEHLLTVLNSVKKNMDGDKVIQFEVHYMQMQTLEQPMANNECGFYVMWAMHQYLGRSTREGNEMREKLQIQKLLDFEIRGFQDELAAFILEEVLSKHGSFAIANSKNRKDYEKSMFDRLLGPATHHVTESSSSSIDEPSTS